MISFPQKPLPQLHWRGNPKHRTWLCVSFLTCENLLTFGFWLFTHFAATAQFLVPSRICILVSSSISISSQKVEMSGMKVETEWKVFRKSGSVHCGWIGKWFVKDYLFSSVARIGCHGKKEQHYNLLFQQSISKGSAAKKT